jgi:hypothetical protein
MASISASEMGARRKRTANWPNSKELDPVEAELAAAGVDLAAAASALATCLTRLAGVKGWGPVWCVASIDNVFKYSH